MISDKGGWAEGLAAGKHLPGTMVEVDRQGESNRRESKSAMVGVKQNIGEKGDFEAGRVVFILATPTALRRSCKRVHGILHIDRNWVWST